MHLDGANVGIVVKSVEQTLTPEQMVDDADAALLAAAQNGRGQVVLFDAMLRQANRRRLDLRVEMRLAASGPLASGFAVAYQPIVCFADGVVVGHEGILGWTNPHFGVVSGSEYLPVAVQVGAIGALGKFVLDQAVARATTIRVAGSPAFVGVNVDSYDLEAGELLTGVERALDDNAVSADALSLEIGAAVLPNGGSDLERLIVLRDRSVRIAVDNVGMGAGAQLDVARELGAYAYQGSVTNKHETGADTVDASDLIAPVELSSLA